MIYVKLHGRIGNHLFQLATAATLASLNNDTFCAVCHKDYKIASPDNCYIWDFVQPYKKTIFSNINILEDIPNNLNLVIQESYKYKKIKYTSNILLDGGFQSYRYFDANIVRELFKIPESIKEEILNRYSEIFSAPLISVNVRRGDYCNIPHKLPVCSKSYFKKAMNMFPIDSRFLFISDDIEWCKKHFKANNIFYLENSTPLVDLYAQTLCTDNIISNSTFSWWGAYLNPNQDKKIICPKPWFGKYAKNKRSDVIDLIPKDWIQIKNRMDFALWLKAIKMGFLTDIKILK